MKYVIEIFGGLLVLVCGLAFVTLRKRSRWLAGLGLLLGVTLVLFLSGVTPDLTATRVTMELKLRVVTGLLGFLMLVATLEAVRRTQMHERYALLWVGTGLVILFFALYPTSILAWLQRVTGMQYVTAIVIIVFAFLLLVSFHFSIMLSRSREDTSRLTRRIALLEQRLVEVERVKPAAPEYKPDTPL
ncbi:MAG: DUF2304 domain-containing protein [Kiritimatiellaeota bacterium]|nr:DUF2304 domain-containing protein [Kiritimatiellota bacterium]